MKNRQIILTVSFGFLCVFLFGISQSLFRFPQSLNVALPAQAAYDSVQRSTTTTPPSSSSPPPPPRKRISFTLQQNRTHKIHYEVIPHHQCPLGERAVRSPIGGVFFPRIGLPKELQGKGVLNFGTTISTDLKIMIMGDSLGIQFTQGFENAAGASSEHHTVIRFTGNGVYTAGNTVAAPVRGGGVVAGWRITAMLQRKNEGAPLPNLGPGWRREDATRLLNHTYFSTISASSPIKTVGSMDVLVFRIMHGWVPFDQITQQTLQETIELAHELLGIKTVVFLNVPFTNNIRTMKEVQEMERKNSMIREFCMNWKPVENGVQRLLVLDYHNFMDELIAANSRAIGMNETADNSHWLIRLGPTNHASVAQSCAILPPSNDPSGCTRNYLTEDGMHPCMETIGNRLSAGIACMLSCVYNHDDPSDEINPDLRSMRSCEDDCNKQFMSVRPVDDANFDD